MLKKPVQVSPFSGPVTLTKAELEEDSSVPALEFKCRWWELHLEHPSHLFGVDMVMKKCHCMQKMP